MSTYTSYTGRVGTICDRVLVLARDTLQDILSDTILLDWINSCYLDVARKHYWSSTRTIDVVADQEEYDLREGTRKTISGAVTNLGSGKVGLPVTAHGYVSGNTIRVANTTNYNGVHLLGSQSLGGANVISITATYVAETCASPDYVVRMWDYDDFIDLYSLRWTDTSRKLIPVESLEIIENIRESTQLTGAYTVDALSWYYHLQGTTIHVAPVPSSAASAGWTLRYAASKTALTGAAPYDNPETPAAFDDLYTYWCLRRFAERDRGSKTALQDWQLWDNKYQIELSRLIGGGTAKPLRMRPGHGR